MLYLYRSIIAISFLFFVLLISRSFLYVKRIITELSLPIYSSAKIDPHICDINPETVPLSEYHLFWYNRLGLGCKDRCE